MSEHQSSSETTIRKTVETPFGAKQVEVPKDLQSREDEMKEYFQGMEEDSDSNPNIIKKSEAEAHFKNQFFEMINFDRMWNGILSYKPTMRAEADLLDYVRKLQTKLQWACAIGFCSSFWALSIYKPYFFTKSSRAMGFVVSGVTGVIYAKLKMSEYAIQLIPR